VTIISTGIIVAGDGMIATAVELLEGDEAAIAIAADGQLG
jgi:hypothetical protein